MTKDGNGDFQVVDLHITQKELNDLKQQPENWCVVHHYERTDGTKWGELCMIGSKEDCTQEVKRNDLVILPNQIKSATKVLVQAKTLLPAKWEKDDDTKRS